MGSGGYCKESKGSQGGKGKAGYEYLLAYKVSVPIYDYTVVFCRRCQGSYPPLSSPRTYDQMVQASRSGNTNIPKGNQQASLEGYIKLTGVSFASLEELLKDYLTYARQNKIPVKAVNLMITLINQAIYLQKRLQASLEEKFVKEGGFRENLFRKRRESKESQGYCKEGWGGKGK